MDVKEKMIFKEIALDYAKRRLEVLESEEEKKESSNEYVKQQQAPRTQLSKVKRHVPHSNSATLAQTKSVETIVIEDESKKPRSQQQSSLRSQQVKRKQNATYASIADDFDSFEAAKKACFSGSKTPKARSRMTSEETSPSGSQKRGRFTFRRSETLTSSPTQQKWMGKSPAKISEGRLKLREGDDLSEPLSSSSRNNIALSDSKVVSPRMARNVDGKKIRTPKSTGKKKTPSPSQQSNLDVWISSRAKSKEENKPFTFSSKFAKSDEDPICVSDESDGETTLPSDNNTHGGFMNDVLSLQNINPRTQKGETSHTNTYSGTHTPRQPASRDSGYCLNAAPVDKYGLTRRLARKEDRQKDSDSDSTLSGIRDQKPDTMVECPLCLGMCYKIFM